MKTQVSLLIAIVTSVLILFQNCAPVSFQSEEIELSSHFEPTGFEICNPNLLPPTQETLQCPEGSIGAGSIRKRIVACDQGIWITGPWGNPESNTCVCAVAGQTVSPMSGKCECPTGKIIQNNQCVIPTCDLNTKPSNLEIGTCPSGLGNTKRVRDVLCDNSTLKWSTSGWSAWDYSSCSCVYAGQILNRNTGSCDCPTGQVLLNRMCQVPTCDPAVKPSAFENLVCPSGAGTANRSRVVSCPASSTTWTTGSWVNDYSKCSCPIPGQTLDAATGTCSCPQGQTVIAGACKVPTCDPNTKPAEKSSLTCPSGAGTAYQTRTVGCPTGSTVWNTGNWIANYSGCTCPVTGQVLNSVTGTCSCPTGQVVFNGACRVPDCDPTTKQALSQSGLSCPNQSSGTFTQTRTATCNQSTYQYEYSNWVPNYSTCSCVIQGQSFNSTTKTCECPTGQVVNGNKCELPPLCPQPAPANVEYKTCPSGVGTASRPRTVSCGPGQTAWSITTGNWNYSTCSCPVIGAQVNAADGSCSCPAGSYEIGGRCGTCAADEVYNAATRSCAKILNCQGYWNGCDAHSGTQSYTVTQYPAHGGAACPASPVACRVDCVGSMSACQQPGVQTYTWSVSPKNGGNSCPYGNGQTLSCVAPGTVLRQVAYWAGTSQGGGGQAPIFARFKCISDSSANGFYPGCWSYVDSSSQTLGANYPCLIGERAEFVDGYVHLDVNVNPWQGEAIMLPSMNGYSAPHSSYTPNGGGGTVSSSRNACPQVFYQYFY